ncbi:MAG: hypothetical protein BWY57_01974 [Betaproteobacteria bacterium ADurb.Bin341]|nr:MAG: hypothetical protein BWY57_01974 [Betaproteobacteria bacterium ADurb.Bin341]
MIGFRSVRIICECYDLRQLRILPAKQRHIIDRRFSFSQCDAHTHLRTKEQFSAGRLILNGKYPDNRNAVAVHFLNRHKLYTACGIRRIGRICVMIRGVSCSTRNGRMIFHANGDWRPPERQRLGHRKCLHCLQQFHINLFHLGTKRKKNLSRTERDFRLADFLKSCTALDRQPRILVFHRRDLRHIKCVGDLNSHVLTAYRPNSRHGKQQAKDCSPSAASGNK